MESKPGEVRTFTVVDLSICPFADEQRGGWRQLDHLTFGAIPLHLFEALEHLARETAAGHEAWCRMCLRTLVGYRRKRAGWVWKPTFLIHSEGHTMTVCKDCADIPDPVNP